MATRIAVADDHERVRERLCRIAGSDPRIELVAEVGDGWAALRVALELAPDVILMDIRMPNLNGIDATRAICAASDRVKVLVISLDGDAALAERALEAGAAGMMLKEEARGLVPAILGISAGQRYLSPKLQALLEARTAGARPPAATAESRLTEAERQVLRLLVTGASGREAASQLKVDGAVLDAHRRQIARKLAPRAASDLGRLLDSAAGGDAATGEELSSPKNRVVPDLRGFKTK